MTLRAPDDRLFSTEGETANRLGMSPRIRAAEVAAILCVTPRAVQMMAAKGLLPGAAQIGKLWTFDLNQLKRHIRAFCIWLYPYPAFLRYAAHSAGGYWARILPLASEIAS